MKEERLRLSKHSAGTGDRFAHQAKAQLQACVKALDSSITVVPVWNKSNREHTIIGSEPDSVREAADAAVRAIGWRHPYFCDADHITLQTVDRFLPSCDFYTIDVADFIGQRCHAADIERFVKKQAGLLGSIRLEGIEETFEITAANASDGGKVSRRCPESRRSLSCHRAGQGQRRLRRGDIDG